MTPEPTKCPCCGQVTRVLRTVHVSLEENRLYYGEHDIKLTSRLAELAYILAEQMPSTVPNEVIRYKMWGGMGAERAESNLNVAVMQLRRILKHINLDIVNTWGTGYRLVSMSKTERTNQPVEGAHAQA